MGILVPYGITFDAVEVFGLAFHLLLKSSSKHAWYDSQDKQMHCCLFYVTVFVGADWLCEK